MQEWRERGVFAENVELMLTGCGWHFVVRRLATTEAIHKTQASLSELHLKRIPSLRVRQRVKAKGGYITWNRRHFIASEKKETFWKPVG